MAKAQKIANSIFQARNQSLFVGLFPRISRDFSMLNDEILRHYYA